MNIAFKTLGENPLRIYLCKYILQPAVNQLQVNTGSHVEFNKQMRKPVHFAREREMLTATPCLQVFT